MPRAGRSPAPRAAPASNRAVGARLTEERLDRILDDLEAQAVSAITREVARQGRYDALGGLLHAPLSATTERLWDEGYRKQTPPADTTRQRYRTPDGAVTSVQTATPLLDDPATLAALETRRAEQQAIAGRLRAGSTLSARRRSRGCGCCRKGGSTGGAWPRR